MNNHFQGIHSETNRKIQTNALIYIYIRQPKNYYNSLLKEHHNTSHGELHLYVQPLFQMFSATKQHGRLRCGYLMPPSTSTVQEHEHVTSVSDCNAKFPRSLQQSTEFVLWHISTCPSRLFRTSSQIRQTTGTSWAQNHFINAIYRNSHRLSS